MNVKTKILIAEHDPIDIELMKNELRQGGINYIAKVVENKKDYVDALKNFIPDIILSDYVFPSFDGETAFKMREEIAPKTPFIFVTSNVGEEIFGAFIKNGVTDYVLKDKMFTLTTKIKRGLQESKEKQEENNSLERLRFKAELLNTIGHAVIVVSLDGIINLWNKSAQEIYGWTSLQALGENVKDLIFSQQPGLLSLEIIDVLNEGNSWKGELLMNRKDGTIFTALVNVSPVYDEIHNLTAFIEVSSDLTERKKIEEKLIKANRLNTFISQINQSIVSIKDVETLFSNACKIAFDCGKFKVAWIGLFDITCKKIRLVEQIGLFDNDVKLFINASFDDIGPQAAILRTGAYYICNDVENDFKIPTWKTFAVDRNIRSFIVLPIRKYGIIIGTFNLYTTEHNFFDKEEIDLLVDVTSDISFAIDLIEDKLQKSVIEENLMRSEARLKEAQALSHIANWEVDLITEVCTWSDELYTIFGINREDIPASLETFLSLFHPEDFNYVKNKIERTFKDFVGSEFSSRMITKEGKIKYLYSYWRFELDINKNPIRLYGILQDVTERKLADEKLEFDSNNLNALINNTGDLMWSVDRNFNLITSNQPFNDMGKVNFGRTITKGDNVLLSSYSPEMQKHFKELYERAFAGETFIEIEYFDSPVELWTEISYYPIRKGNEIIGTACHSRDITELKKSEIALFKSESRLKEAQAIAHISNWEIDLITSINTWSDEFYMIFGIKHGEINPSPESFLSLLHPEDYNYAKESMDKAFLTFADSGFFCRMIAKDGTLKYLSAEWRFEFDNTRQPIRLFGILQDITEQKHAELERIKITEDLIQRNKDLEQFTYIVSHNLRAPVSNIMGFSEALRTLPLNKEEREDMQHSLSTSVIKLNRMILDLNMILQTKKNISEMREITSFSHLIKNIMVSIDEQIQKDKVEIRTDFTEIDKVLTLKSYLYSIFYNLIINSIQYRQLNLSPVIEIKSRQLKDGLEITFTDNGLGIDLVKNRAQVFGLYKRFHPNHEGRGMGLFMIKTQVETLGGKINIESEVNKGTKFIILLPV